MNRDDINKFLEIVRELEEEHGHANYLAIQSKWTHKASKELQQIIDKMKRDGNIYEPKNLQYKVV